MQRSAPFLYSHKIWQGSLQQGRNSGSLTEGVSYVFSCYSQCAAWAGVVVAVPAIWDGSADISWYKPDAQKFTLMTAEELAGVAKLVNEGTSDFKGKTIALGADIFLRVPLVLGLELGLVSRGLRGRL